MQAIAAFTFCGFLPHSQSYFLFDQTGLTIGNTDTRSTTLRLPTQHLDVASSYLTCNGHLLQSTAHPHRVSLHSLPLLSRPILSFGSPTAVTHAYYLSSTLFFITSDNCLWVARDEDPENSTRLLELGRQVTRLQALNVDNSFYVYYLYDTHELNTVKVSVSHGREPYHLEAAASENGVWDFVVINDRVVKLIRRGAGRLFLDELDTELQQLGDYRLQELPVVKKIDASGKAISVGSATGLVNMTDNDLDTVVVYDDRLHRPVHRRTAVGKPFSQELQVSSEGLKHVIYWIQGRNLQVSHAKFSEFSNEYQDKIARNIHTVFNQEGILNLFFEEPLKLALGIDHFNPVNSGSFIMFKFLIRSMARKFSKAYFASENKNLNSHSNFQRFNRYSGQYAMELDEQIEKLINSQAIQDAYQNVLKQASLLKYFQNQMTAKIMKQYNQLLILQNHREGTIDNYRQSIENYKTNLFRIETIWIIATYLRNIPNPTRPNSFIAQYINRRKGQIVNITRAQNSPARKDSQKHGIVIIQNYFTKFSNIDWNDRAISPQNFLLRLLRSLPFQTLYFLLSILPAATNFRQLFSIDRQTEQVIKCIKRMEQPLDIPTTTSYLQFIARSKSQIIPEYLYIFLARSALSKHMNGTAAAILHSKVNVDKWLKEVIAIHVEAGKVEACYLLLKHYLKDVIGDTATVDEKKILELIDTSLKNMVFLPILKLTMAMTDKQLSYTKQKLPAYGISADCSTLTRL